MGNITIYVPQHIQVEYTLEQEGTTHHLLDMLNTLLLRTAQTGQEKKDELLGLFSDQSDLLDEVTEQAMQSRETDALRVDS